MFRTHTGCPAMSHPVWVRGLKLNQYEDIKKLLASHPVWVRGLKLIPIYDGGVVRGRTPCGCVD